MKGHGGLLSPLQQPLPDSCGSTLNCPPAYAIGSSQGGTSQWTKAVNLDIPHHRPAAF